MQKQQAVAESILLRVSQYNKDRPLEPILLFTNDIQKSFIYFPPDNASIIRTAHPIEHQTFYVIRGTAKMEIKRETLSLKRGSMVVVPPHQSFSLRKTKDFLAITIVSPGTNHKRVEEVVNKLFPSTEKVRGKKIFRTNLFDLLTKGPRKKFVDTLNSILMLKKLKYFFPLSIRFMTLLHFKQPEFLFMKIQQYSSE